MAATKSVRIPEEEHKLLKEHAGRVERTLSQVLVKAIRRYCGKDGQ